MPKPIDLTKPLLTTGEVAKLLGYSRQGVNRKFDGILTVKRVGKAGHRRWLTSEILDLIKK